jgi:hypothetical protein
LNEIYIKTRKILAQHEELLNSIMTRLEIEFNSECAKYRGLTIKEMDAVRGMMQKLL